jgi:Gas vesicle protein
MAERAEPTLYNRREVNPRQAQVPQAGGPANLADILERVLDKGIVIAGDIQINLLDIELLTIKLRLLIASVERAQEMGINWWQSDPTLSSNAKELEEENRDLRKRLERLEKAAGLPAPREGEEVILEEHRREEVVVGGDAEGEEKEVETHHEEVVESEEESPRTSRGKGSSGRKASGRG